MRIRWPLRGVCAARDDAAADGQALPPEEQAQTINVLPAEERALIEAARYAPG